jgi:hypothetical protein
MTSFTCDTSEHEEAKKLPSICDHRQELEILHVQEELISLMDNLLMLLTLHELLYERTKERELTDFVTSDILPPSKQESSEKSKHSHVSFAPEGENSFLKERPL